MSEFKGTPGPWIFSESNVGSSGFTDSYGDKNERREADVTLHWTWGDWDPQS